MLCIGGNGDIVMLVLMTTAIRVAVEECTLYLVLCFVMVSVVLVVVLVVVTLVELGWWWLGW